MEDCTENNGNLKGDATEGGGYWLFPLTLNFLSCYNEYTSIL